MIGLGAGDSLNRAYGQSESNAVVSTVQSSSEEAGLSAQLPSAGSDTRKSMRERSEPTVTGAAMHVALFVPRN